MLRKVPKSNTATFGIMAFTCFSVNLAISVSNSVLILPGPTCRTIEFVDSMSDGVCPRRVLT